MTMQAHEQARARLLDYLAGEFGVRWFKTREVAHPDWNWSRASTLRSQGLLEARESAGHQSTEYRVVLP